MLKKVIGFSLAVFFLAGCGTLPSPYDSASSDISSNFWRTGQYRYVDEGVAMVGARSTATQYRAFWNPITHNLHAEIAGSAHRYWHVTGVGSAWLCHAFPVGWCFDAQYYSPEGSRLLRFRVLQENNGSFWVSLR